MSKSRCGLYLIAFGPILAAVALYLTACRKSAAIVPQFTPDVTVTNVLQQDVPQYSEWVGTTEGFVNADIYPKVSGYIVKQDYQDGDLVHKGQVLFEIDSREYQAALDEARGNLEQAEAQFKRDKLTLDRFTDLFGQHVISRQEFDNQTQATRANEAQVKAKRAALETARLNLEWTRVTCPLDGIASIATAQMGDLVSTTTLLTTVAQLNPIKVEFQVNEQTYLRFADQINQDPVKRAANGPRLQITLSDGSTYKHDGRIFDVNGQVDKQTGTIKVQAVFPNPDNILRPGLYAKVRASTGTLHNALVIPQNAILQTQGQSQVAVVGPDNKVAMRNIQVGQTFGSYQVVQSGISAGDRVVSEGLQKVHDGIQVSPHLVASTPPQENPPSSGSQPSMAASSPGRS
jgi:membrane fusion protein, multidrug efflux system